MIRYIRKHLGVKLFLSYLAVIGIGALVLTVATGLALPTAFERHLGASQQLLLNGDIGAGQGARGGRFGEMGAGKTLFDDFKASFNDAIVVSGIVALIVGLLASWLFSRGVVAPVRALMTASSRIAEGHYADRVADNRSDELGLLARSFNQMAEQLEQVENMRRQLIGDVSHELRTPLTAIKGSMEGLIDGVLTADEETYLQIHQETNRLGRLVDDLQELSRVEAGAIQMEMRPVRLSNVVETVAKRLGYQFDAQRIALVLDLPPELPRVLADEDRIIQVLTNLLGNALRHTPEGGTVRVAAFSGDGEVIVSVADTGIGIAQEHLAQIFTRFYRVDKSRSRQTGGGSGIGLTVAKYLVEAHGGKIWVESGGANQGAKFSFSLPIARKD
ncbi:MAG: ATP-binding protein [Anaerolineales bacterium]|nr:ATP-binding protein [Anaerolineales bacterium]